MKLNFNISIINPEKFHDKKLESEKVKIINFRNEDDSIIKVYDDHNIFILPSYTEGHPQVLDESLSRLRPVIIFEEISHVIGNREGVFVSKRNSDSLSEKIQYIMENYKSIQEKMSKNVLPTKEDFLKKIFLILSKTNN